jgi:hypothetical protein
MDFFQPTGSADMLGKHKENPTTDSCRISISTVIPSTFFTYSTEKTFSSMPYCRLGLQKGLPQKLQNGT